MKSDFGRYIDHTLLRPIGTTSDIRRLCTEAIEYGMAAVCIFPSYVPMARDLLKDSRVKIATVIAFPFGVTFTEIKEAEMRASAARGADEMDFVINIASLKSGDDKSVEDEMHYLTAKARTLGVPAPRVTLRFHPTTDDYERVTGQAWFTSGAVVNGELHLLPLAVLRDRGVLERTIRHELVHLMTDGVFERRPQWVREGAAIYFAGTKPIPGEVRQRPAFRPEPRLSCPADNELMRPVSVGALSNAYTRARECFAKQIQAGKSWRDVT